MKIASTLDRLAATLAPGWALAYNGESWELWRAEPTGEHLERHDGAGHISKIPLCETVRLSAGSLDDIVTAATGAGTPAGVREEAWSIPVGQTDPVEVIHAAALPSLGPELEPCSCATGCDACAGTRSAAAELVVTVTYADRVEVRWVRAGDALGAAIVDAASVAGVPDDAVWLAGGSPLDTIGDLDDQWRNADWVAGRLMAATLVLEVPASGSVDESGRVLGVTFEAIDRGDADAMLELFAETAWSTGSKVWFWPGNLSVFDPSGWVVAIGTLDGGLVELAEAWDLDVAVLTAAHLANR